MFASAMPNVIVPIIYFLAEGGPIPFTVIIPFTDAPAEDDQWQPQVAEAVQKEWQEKKDAPKLQFITYPGESLILSIRI